MLRACAAPRDGHPESWISQRIAASYEALHLAGHAHSIECWQEGELVGGLYGVRLGRAFFGESMFSRRTDASKVALAWLVARLKAGGFTLLDCQFITGHLASLGAVTVPREDYVALLGAALGGAGSGWAVGSGAGRVAGGEDDRPGADFRALDRLLVAAAGDSATEAPPGKVIAQLLGQTS